MLTSQHIRWLFIVGQHTLLPYFLCGWFVCSEVAEADTESRCLPLGATSPMPAPCIPLGSNPFPFSFLCRILATNLRCTSCKIVELSTFADPFPCLEDTVDRDSIIAITSCKSKLCQRLQAKSRHSASEKGLHLVRVVGCGMSLRIAYLVTIS